MDAIQALLTRRSIRRFRLDPVSSHDVEQMLDVLFRSPSAADARPWQFGIIDRRELLDQLAAAMPKCEMLAEAPLAVLICAEPAREKIPGFWPQDCAAATENLLIAAHALGYGAVWIGLHPVSDRERAVRNLLRLPLDLVPFALVAIGRPDETPSPDERRDPTRIHYNEW